MNIRLQGKPKPVSIKGVESEGGEIMEQEALYRKLVELSDVDDFNLELKPSFSKSYWGRYYPSRKLIRLYLLDENGEEYDETILIKEGLHELTHHIQYNHIPFWERKKGTMHDDMFWDIYKGMMSKAFKRGDELNGSFNQGTNYEQ